MSYRYTPGDRDYFRPPHGGRPPSDEAVHAATVRYVEWGRKNGITPSPEWEARHGNSPGAQPAAPERKGSMT